MADTDKPRLTIRSTVGPHGIPYHSVHDCEGVALPRQSAVRVTSEAGAMTMVTVTFYADGKSVQFE